MALLGKDRSTYWVLVSEHESERPLAKSRRRWGYNIKLGSREIEWGVVEWIHLVRDRYRWRAVVNTVVNLRVPGKMGNILDSSGT